MQFFLIALLLLGLGFLLYHLDQQSTRLKIETIKAITEIAEIAEKYQKDSGDIPEDLKETLNKLKEL